MLHFLKQPVKVGTIVRIWTPIIIGGIGLSAIVAWVFNLDVLLNYFCDHVKMKPMTAIAAIVASFMIISKGTVKKWLSILMLVLMGHLLIEYFNYVFEVATGCFAEVPNQIETIKTNMPSLATIVMYLTMVYCTQCSNCAMRGGKLILFVSGVAMLGHIFGVSEMYWYIPKVSTGMAAPTALIGVHIGFWMIHGFNNTPISFNIIEPENGDSLMNRPDKMCKSLKYAS